MNKSGEQVGVRPSDNKALTHAIKTGYYFVDEDPAGFFNSILEAAGNQYDGIVISDTALSRTSTPLVEIIDRLPSDHRLNFSKGKKPSGNLLTIARDPRVNEYEFKTYTFTDPSKDETVLYLPGKQPEVVPGREKVEVGQSHLRMARAVQQPQGPTRASFGSSARHPQERAQTALQHERRPTAIELENLRHKTVGELGLVAVDVLGQGANGIVLHGFMREHGMVIVKVAIPTPKSAQSLQNEAEVLRRLKTARNVHVPEIIQSANNYMILRPSNGYNSLQQRVMQDILNGRAGGRVNAAAAIAREVAALHSAGVIHGDVKQENFLFSATSDFRKAEIIDFGSSKMYMSHARFYPGYSEYSDDLKYTLLTVAEVLSGEDFMDLTEVERKKALLRLADQKPMLGEIYKRILKTLDYFAVYQVSSYSDLETLVKDLEIVQRK